MKKWKVAIFDWNGTLADDFHMSYKSVEKIFNNFFLPTPSIQDFQNNISTNFWKFYEKFGISINQNSKNKMASIRKKIFSETKAKDLLRNGSRELIEMAYKKGLKLTIVSGESPDILGLKLKESELIDFFSIIKSGIIDKENSLKEIIDYFSINPKEAFLIDDSYDGNSIAKKLGISTIAFVGEGSYSSKKRIIDAKPDFICTQLSSVCKML